ncbi:MAG: tetratricopeptide repeat protein [Planctomycetota bacterium]|nr:tetratricopeptide repeat protein [Planctomycetota bacterium]
MPAHTNRQLLPLLVILLFGFACGGEPTDSADPAATPLVGPREDEPRSDDPRLARGREALEAGQLDTALTLAEQLGSSSGVEGPLLRARALFLGRDPVGALAAVAEARSLAPTDSRVFATGAEFLALGRRGADAEDELTRGTELAGPSPDLARARAILALTRPGQGALALALLNQAIEADPRLPYCTWPRSQAELLTGRLVLGQGDIPGALEHAARAIELAPDLAEAHELTGDAMSSGGDLIGAIVAYERAAELGIDVRLSLADVHTRAAMFSRTAGDHLAAEKHYLDALALGLSREQLSSGADYLAERANEAHHAGVAARIRGQADVAAAEQARALQLNPGHVGARHELASMRFEIADYAGAALLWRGLFEEELALSGDGASHLNLARALKNRGLPDRAREALEAYLDAWPDGAFAPETEEMLGRLP